MRRGHGNLQDGSTAKGVWRHEGKRLGLSFALLLTVAIGCRPALAQFSGPALDASTVINPPVKITTDPAILYPGHRDVYLGNEDFLSIHIYGSPEYAPTPRVGLDGTIQLPLIGSVQVEELTIHQAQDLIAKKLVEAGMYRDPQVSIQITESPNLIATVVGELHGVVPIIGERRLYDVLAAVGNGGGFSSSATTIVVGSGGLPPTASHVLTINRPGLAEPIVIDLGIDPAKSAAANIPIFPKDTIIVPRVGVAYLLGAFKIQGAIPLSQNSPLTLMKVAALAGGPGWEGKMGDLRIIRSVGLSRQVVRVNIQKVINGKEPDPVIEAEDIIFLPTSPMKAVLKSGGVGTLLGVASLLLVAAQQ
jgi:polysaccharide biosynthesis/export protein